MVKLTQTIIQTLFAYWSDLPDFFVVIHFFLLPFDKKKTCQLQRIALIVPLEQECVGVFFSSSQQKEFNLKWSLFDVFFIGNSFER